MSLYYRGRHTYLSYVKPLVTATVTENYGYNPDHFWKWWWHNAGSEKEHSIEKDGVNEWESRVHYNALETSLSTACARYEIDPDGKRVLDVGSGTGHWIDVWDSYGADAVGIDIARSLIESLERDDIYHADIREKTSFESDSFDIVSGFGVFFHLVRDTDLRDALEEINRVLTSGGYLVFSGELGWLTRPRQFHSHESDSQPREVMKYLRSWRTWQDELRTAGFEPVGRIKTSQCSDMDTPENNLAVARVD